MWRNYEFLKYYVIFFFQAAVSALFWHVIRKVIWYVTKLRIFEMLCNIFFSSSCLCPALTVSVLYFEEKIGIGYVNIHFQFHHISNDFSFDIHVESNCFDKKTNKPSFWLVWNSVFLFFVKMEWARSLIWCLSDSLFYKFFVIANLVLMGVWLSGSKKTIFLRHCV